MKLTASLLTWNRSDCLASCFRPLVQEAADLRALGHDVELLVVVNGSDDDTLHVLNSFIRADVNFHLYRFSVNLGAAVARNHALRFADAVGADYHLLLDGDVQLVPGSWSAMLNYLVVRPEYCAIGPFWDCRALHDGVVSGELLEVQGDFDKICAPTQYGLLRRFVLERFRFDENFGPGYGFEDEDFGIQLYTAGLKSRMFSNIRYGHHGYHSSLKCLAEAKTDVVAMWEQRKAYILGKWSGPRAADQRLQNLLKVLRDEPCPQVPA
jgi:glycosyltransferase involved in cell wall biosynthesis